MGKIIRSEFLESLLSGPGPGFSLPLKGAAMTLEEELENYILEVRPRFGRPRKAGEDQGEVQGEPVALDPESAEGKLAILYLPRNVELILDHFGMGSLFWPTLQDLSDTYPGMETRERARQIIEKYYGKRRPETPLPKAAAAAELLESRAVWSESAFIAELHERGLTRGIEHAVSVIAYLQTQGLVPQLRVYQPNFSLATRSTYLTHRERFLTTAPIAKRLQSYLEKGRSLVGVNGLCRISHIDPDMPPGDREALSAALRANPKAWVADHQGDLWFFFDDRENRLVHYAEKIFSQVESCDVGIVAALMANALPSRTSKVGEYPDADLIEAWIRSANPFLLRGNELRFLGEKGDLNPIEKDTITFMEGRGALSSAEITAELSAKGHGNAIIQKQIFSSCLVHADRSGGRGHFRFTLVKVLASVIAPVEESEYDRVKQKLMELESTDIPAETKARSEQRILSRWLFGDQTQCGCALCGRDFAISGLVTAHKKKRSICSDAERRDPYIVFPLCKFGCDHLYEHGFVTVRQGLVVPGRAPAGETEAGILGALFGRTVNPRWTAGPESYFDNIPEGKTLAGEEDIAAE